MKMSLKENLIARKEYTCPWCQSEFKAYAEYSQGKADDIKRTKGKKSSLSTQIKCPNCLNFISTWSKIKIGEKWIKKRN